MRATVSERPPTLTPKRTRLRGLYHYSKFWRCVLSESTYVVPAGGVKEAVSSCVLVYERANYTIDTG